MILNAIYISPEKPKERNLCFKKKKYLYLLSMINIIIWGFFWYLLILLYQFRKINYDSVIIRKPLCNMHLFHALDKNLSQLCYMHDIETYIKSFESKTSPVLQYPILIGIKYKRKMIFFHVYFQQLYQIMINHVIINEFKGYILYIEFSAIFNLFIEVFNILICLIFNKTAISKLIFQIDTSCY
jgi:hypothetical protein